MKHRNRGISIILPALNEAENLQPLVGEVTDYFSSTDRSYEIIIVNDGSTDQTGEIAEQLSATHANLSTIHHATNEGYGKSLRDGFEAGKYDYLFFTDADRQFSISNLDRFLPAIEDDRTDMVIGYRINRQDPHLRKFLAWCFNRTVRILFSIPFRDIDCAFKLFKATVFKSLAMKSNDFLFNAELLAKAQIKKCAIVQIGVDHFPRPVGESTVSYNYIFLTLKRLFALFREVRAFKMNESSTR